jgi:hypothetical protein
VTADPQARGDQRPRRSAAKASGAARRRGAALIALIALFLGIGGLALSAAGVAVQLLPRQFTAAQQRQIMSWEVANRWRVLTAGQIFPQAVAYQLSAQVLEDTAPLNLRALRVGIAPQSGCDAGVTGAAAAVLRHGGCQAILRATYVDATTSYVMTLGVAVLPTASAAAAADAGLAAPRLADAHASDDAGGLAPGVGVVRFRGTAATLYDYNRQISASFSQGPYIFMYAAGYAGRRPRVQVSTDRYSYEEMASMARGVAVSVADRLAAEPAPPHCPGAPGC